MESTNDKSPEQKFLIATVTALRAMTLEDETRPCNAAIDAVTAYCKVEDGGCGLPDRKRCLTSHATSTIVKVEEDTRPLVAAKPWHQAFNITKGLVY